MEVDIELLENIASSINQLYIDIDNLKSKYSQSSICSKLSNVSQYGIGPFINNINQEFDEVVTAIKSLNTFLKNFCEDFNTLQGNLLKDSNSFSPLLKNMFNNALYLGGSADKMNIDKLNDTINQMFTLDSRFASMNTTGKFKVGSAVNQERLKQFVNSDTGKLFFKYGEMYGIDPILLIAMASQESGLDHEANSPGGSQYNNAAVGICQLEKPATSNTTFHAYNYETRSNEEQHLTMEGALDIEQNIKMGAMHFQEGLEKSKGNIPILIQSYNYGSYGMDKVLNSYASSTGQTVDQVKENYSDTGWINTVKDFHNNPSKYISGWRESTYGDANYVSNVLRYFPGDKTYYNYDGNKYVVDINTSQVLYKIPIDQINE